MTQQTLNQMAHDLSESGMTIGEIASTLGVKYSQAYYAVRQPWTKTLQVRANSQQIAILENELKIAKMQELVNLMKEYGVESVDSMPVVVH